VAAQVPEITYLCRAVSEYFRDEVGPEQVVWAFSGVRSLHDDPAAKAKDLSRDYVLELEASSRDAPLLSVFGGKITTARRLAEEALERLTPFLQMPPPWTHRVPLPGGDFPWNGIDALVERARGLWPFLSEAHAMRLVRAYGTRLDRIIGEARSIADLGPALGGDLTGAEVRYLMRHEWAETADDVLWRRSKLGPRFASDEQAALARFIDDARRAGSVEPGAASSSHAPLASEGSGAAAE
jgi:glycerol-3-phosphate dehydrogenase